ncbi:putative Actin-binding FH2 protein, partial [Trachipleistophora hominis]
VCSSVLSHILKHILAKSEISNELNFLQYVVNDPFVAHLLLSLNFLGLITSKVKDRSVIDGLKDTSVMHSHEYTKFLDGALNFCEFSKDKFLENVKREVKKYLADQSVRLAVELKEIERNKTEYIRVCAGKDEEGADESAVSGAENKEKIGDEAAGAIGTNNGVKNALNMRMDERQVVISNRNIENPAGPENIDQSSNLNNKTGIKNEMVCKNKTDIEELTKKMNDTLPISNSIDVKKVGEEDNKMAKPPKVLKKPPRRPPGRAAVKKTNPEIVKWRSKSYKTLHLERNKCEIFKNYDEDKLMKKFTENDFVPFIRKVEKVKIFSEAKETTKGIFPTKKSYALSIALGRVKDADETFIKKIMNLEMVDENVVKQILTYFPTENEIVQIKECEDLGRAEMFYKVVIADIDIFYECLNCILLNYILDRSEIINMIDILQNVVSYILVDEFLAEFVNISLFVVNIMSKCVIEGFFIDNLNEFIRDENKKLFHLILSKMETTYKRNEYLSQAKAINYDLLCVEYEEILALYSKIKGNKYELIENKNVMFMENIDHIKDRFDTLKESYAKLNSYLGKNVDEKGFELLDRFYDRAGVYYKANKGC